LDQSGFVPVARVASRRNPEPAAATMAATPSHVGEAAARVRGDVVRVGERVPVQAQQRGHADGDVHRRAQDRGQRPGQRPGAGAGGAPPVRAAAPIAAACQHGHEDPG